MKLERMYNSREEKNPALLPKMLYYQKCNCQFRCTRSSTTKRHPHPPVTIVRDAARGQRLVAEHPQFLLNAAHTEGAGPAGQAELSHSPAAQLAGQPLSTTTSRGTAAALASPRRTAAPPQPAAPQRAGGRNLTS